MIRKKTAPIPPLAALMPVVLATPLSFCIVHAPLERLPQAQYARKPSVPSPADALGAARTAAGTAGWTWPR